MELPQLLKPEACAQMEKIKLVKLDWNIIFPTADPINPRYCLKLLRYLNFCVLAAETKRAKCVLGTWFF